MGEEPIVLQEESDRIIGACFDVYKRKDNGFLEAVYQAHLPERRAERPTCPPAFPLR